jgi:hypothetical protein
MEVPAQQFPEGAHLQGREPIIDAGDHDQARATAGDQQLLAADMPFCAKQGILNEN